MFIAFEEISKTKERSMSRPLLMLLFFVSFTAIAYAGGKHAGGHANDKASDSHWSAPKLETERSNPIPRSEASIARGKSIYTELCADCHGNSGIGDGPVAKDLTTQPTNLVMMSGEHKDGDLAWKIKTGKGDMPSWADELSDDEIWDTVNYLKDSATKKENDHQ
jgi:mono/diheme cytochrome c family protein